MARCVAAWLLAAATVAEVRGAELRPETLAAWNDYVLRTAERVEAELGGGRGFLVQDFLPARDAAACREKLAAGEVFVHRMKSEDSVPHGMIHHWLGSVFLPGVGLDQALGWLQDYDRHAEYFAEVEASRLLRRQGDRFTIHLRLRRKKLITVHYATEHLAEYRRHSEKRVSSKSTATKIAQLDGPGTPRERELPPGQDHGFLWRLNSYWRFGEKDGGVVVECESLSLSRSIPPGLGWLVGRFVESVPRESMAATLQAIREGVAASRR